MFTPLAKIIPKTFRKYGLTHVARATLICEKYRKIAPSILPPKVMPHAWPKCVRGKTLFLGTDHPAYAAEVIQQRELLLKSINEDLKRYPAGLRVEVKDIKIKVESLPQEPDR